MGSEDHPMHSIFRIIFFALIGPGIGGNALLFVKHVPLSIMGLQKKPVDLILIQLAFANVLTLCVARITERRSPFHSDNFLSDIGCKIVVYMERVARGLSICTTCLLSMVQATTISPKTILWRKLKPQTTWQVLSCLLLCWIINLLLSSNLLHYITAVSSMNRSEVGVYAGPCYLLSSGQTVRWLFLSLMALRDVLFQGFMGWSSGHMAFRLYEHHQRVLYLHSSRLAVNSSPEIRATLNILILMACFILFYLADFIFSFYIGSMVTRDFTILNIKIFLGLGYAVLSPFVLISKDVYQVTCWHSD